MGRDTTNSTPGKGGRGFGRGGKGKGKPQPSPDKGSNQPTGRRNRGNRGPHPETPNKFHPYTINQPPRWSFVDVREHLATKIAVDLGEGGHDIKTSIMKNVKLDFMDQRPKKVYLPKTESHGVLTAEQRAEMIVENKDPDATWHTPEDAAEQEFHDEMYRNEMKNWSRRREYYRVNWTKAYDYIWDKFLPKTMQSRIRSLSNYQTEIYEEPLALLKAVELAMSQPTEDQYDQITKLNALKTFINFRMEPNEEIPDFRRRFDQTVALTEQYVGKHMVSYGVQQTAEYKAEQSKEVRKKMVETDWEAFLALKFTDAADKSKYGDVLKKWSSQYADGVDQYPKTLDKATSVLTTHLLSSKPSQGRDRSKRGTQDQKKSDKSDSTDTKPKAEASLAQTGKGKPGDTKYFCLACGDPDHQINQCPKKDSIPKDKWVINRAKQLAHPDDASVNSSATGARSTSTNPLDWSGFQNTVSSNDTELALKQSPKKDFSSLRYCFILDSGSTI